MTEKLNVPEPLPVLVAPLLNVKVHAPVAVTLPVMLAPTPVQIVLFTLVMAAVGRVFTFTVVLPVKPADTAAQFASVKDEIV